MQENVSSEELSSLSQSLQVSSIADVVETDDSFPVQFLDGRENQVASDLIFEDDRAFVAISAEASLKEAPVTHCCEKEGKTSSMCPECVQMGVLSRNNSTVQAEIVEPFSICQNSDFTTPERADVYLQKSVPNTSEPNDLVVPNSPSVLHGVKEISPILVPDDFPELSPTRFSAPQQSELDPNIGSNFDAPDLTRSRLLATNTEISNLQIGRSVVCNRTCHRLRIGSPLEQELSGLEREIHFFRHFILPRAIQQTYLISEQPFEEMDMKYYDDIKFVQRATLFDVYCWRRRAFLEDYYLQRTLNDDSFQYQTRSSRLINELFPPFEVWKKELLSIFPDFERECNSDCHFLFAKVPFSFSLTRDFEGTGIMAGEIVIGSFETSFDIYQRWYDTKVKYLKQQPKYASLSPKRAKIWIKQSIPTFQEMRPKILQNIDRSFMAKAHTNDLSSTYWRQRSKPNPDTSLFGDMRAAQAMLHLLDPHDRLEQKPIPSEENLIYLKELIRDPSFRPPYFPITRANFNHEHVYAWLKGYQGPISRYHCDCGPTLAAVCYCDKPKAKNSPLSDSPNSSRPDSKPASATFSTQNSDSPTLGTANRSTNWYDSEEKAQDSSLVSEYPDVTNFRAFDPTANAAFPVFRANARGRGNNKCRTWSLLDSCSDQNFMSERLMKKLKLKHELEPFCITTMHGTKCDKVKVARFTLHSLHNGAKHSVEVKAIVVKDTFNVAGFPPKEISMTALSSNAYLTYDPRKPNHMPEEADVLLSASVYASIVIEARNKKLLDNYRLQKTLMGDLIWGGASDQPQNSLYIAAKTTNPEGQKSCFVSQMTPDKSSKAEIFQHPSDGLEKLWAMEAFGVPETPSDEEIAGHKRAKDIMLSDLTFAEDNGYTVPYLWREGDRGTLRTNRSLALKRFTQLEKRFSKDSRFKALYVEAMSLYLERGDALPECPLGLLESQPYNEWFLPHSAVIRESAESTKVRIVFDGSAKNDRGKSLNDCLLAGPPIHPDLVGILLRFRLREVAIVADIEKMFLCVHASEDTQPFQRFLWRVNEDEPIMVYRMVNMVFGLVDSPFKAIYTVKTHADKLDDCCSKNILNRDVFVDDLITGAESDDDALEIFQTIFAHMKKAGLVFKKWVSNSKFLMHSIPPDLRGEAGNIALFDQSENEHTQDETPRKALGVAWLVSTDQLTFSVLPDMDVSGTTITKRVVSSLAAKIFDPMGYLAPFLLRAKLVLQKCWMEKIGWDDQVDQSIEKEFLKWLEEVPALQKFSIPRFIVGNVSDETHSLAIFGDASYYGIGVAVYLVGRSVPTQPHLIFGKCKVAPINENASIARKELLAALLAVQIGTYLSGEIGLSAHLCQYYTDSTTTFQWINGSPDDWKVFVRNRIVKIKELSSVSQWNHVDGEQNPADLSSRGLSSEELLKSTLWFKGPSFLEQDFHDRISSKLDHVPVAKTSSDPLVSNELRPGKITNFRTEKADVRAWWGESLDKLPLGKQIRVLNRCFSLFRPVPGGPLEWSPGGLTILSQYQKRFLPLPGLSDENKVNAKNRKLELYLASDNLIRRRGRLDHAPLPEEDKNPVYLPKPLTSLDREFIHNWVTFIHETHGHVGVTWTAQHIRLKVYIPQLRKVVSNVVSKCVVCKKAYPKVEAQKMGELPEARMLSPKELETYPPFGRVGIDFAGPLRIKQGDEEVKGYILLFTCMVTRAVHLELTLGMSLASFMNAYRRFTGRRGVPSDIWSDNAKTFKAGALELKAFQKLLNLTLQSSKIQGHVNWHFITERGPWQGGVYERMVRSVKEALKRNVGTAFLTEWQMYTVLCEVEAQINNRPLALDESECVVTPAHLLYGRNLFVPPQLMFPSDSDYVRDHADVVERWRKRQRLSFQFFNRWKKEYFLGLQQRSKWLKSRSIEEDTVVLVLDNSLKSKGLGGAYPLARIVSTISGRDGLVRTVRLRLANGKEFTRPLNICCPLETNISFDEPLH